jgi:hypothetical protein
MPIMNALKDFDTVKVVRLLDSERKYDGSENVRRPPRIGDTGTIVHINSVDGKTTGYMVEKVAPNGYTIWLADFLPDEIELAENPPT